MRGEELLATLREEARAGTPVAAVLRHAARHPISDPERPELAELTGEGRKHAVAFGAGLAGFARVRIFHSPVLRCRQTAECIALGGTRAGAGVEIAGARPELGIDFIRDLKEAGRLSELHRDHFVRLWFEGAVPPGVADPIPELAARKLAFVRARLGEIAGASGTLDLHVSHDWNILALREHLVGVRHEEAGWLAFLDGLTFRPCGPGLRAVYRRQARVI
ncbi:MAG: hypothetical protein C0502_05400 [Opitutus sp.]|nr:hypothetical protein [Opitutus sp.]